MSIRELGSKRVSKIGSKRYGMQCLVWVVATFFGRGNHMLVLASNLQQHVSETHHYSGCVNYYHNNHYSLVGIQN